MDVAVSMRVYLPTFQMTRLRPQPGEAPSVHHWSTVRSIGTVVVLVRGAGTRYH